MLLSTGICLFPMLSREFDVEQLFLRSLLEGTRLLSLAFSANLGDYRTIEE